MDSLPGDLKTPLFNLLEGIGETVEFAAFEKTLIGETDAVFDLGLVLKVPHSRQASEKSPPLDVPQENVGEPWIKSIHPGYGLWEIIDDKVVGKCRRRK